MRPPEFGPGALTRQSQARQRNRTICNFQPSQPPVGREKSHNATQILRAENVLPGPRGNPRNGVRGKRPMDLGGTKWSRSPSDASPGAFCLLFRHGKRRSPPAGGETPLRNDSKRRAESSRPTGVAPHGERAATRGRPYKSAKKAVQSLPKGAKQNGHRLPIQNRFHQTVR